MPKFKRPEVQQAYQRIMANYVLVSGAELVLESTLANYEFYCDCRDQINRDGYLVGGKKHPLHGAMADCYKNFLAGLRQLALDVEPEEFVPEDDAPTQG
jgi:hypothetical protein